MQSGWFANRGQIVQAACAILACIFASIKAWPDMKASNLFSFGSIIFYFLIATVISSFAILFQRSRGGGVPATNATWSDAQSEIGRMNGQKTILELHGTTVETSSDPKIIYKSKARAMLKNASRETVYLHFPSWIMTVDNVPLQFELGYQYQLESTLGSWYRGNWSSIEGKEIQVPAGWSFRIWIGLDSSIPVKDIERRRATRRLGTLRIPFTIAGREERWEGSI